MKHSLMMVLVLGLCKTSCAQLSADFESASGYTGSASGTNLTTPGQAGWYVPSVAQSTDWFCYAYANNALGIKPNPTGGEQFIAGLRTSDNKFPRAEHTLAFDLTKNYVVSFDVTSHFVGTPIEAGSSLGSFNMGLSGTRSWAMGTRWVTFSGAPKSKFELRLMAYFANGQSTGNTGTLPSPAWTNLVSNAWYRVTFHWDFASNRVTRACIRALPSGTESCTDLVGEYLAGGISSTLPAPTSLRLFVGNEWGNTNAYDNLTIQEDTLPPPCYPDLDGDGSLSIDDFIAFQTLFAMGNDLADCDGSSFLTISDFICFQTAFAIGC